MSDKMWCVYSHATKTDGTVFYIGCGNANRPYVTHGRSDKWKSVVKNRGLVVKILKTFTNKANAISFEQSMIRSMLPECNKEGRKPGEILGHRISGKTYILKMTPEEHTSIKRRAATVGISMKQYILDLAVYGKVQHKKPK